MSYSMDREAYNNSNYTYGTRWQLNWGKPASLSLTLLCLITPGTNWLLMFTKKLWNKTIWVNK